MRTRTLAICLSLVASTATAQTPEAAFEAAHAEDQAMQFEAARLHYDEVSKAPSPFAERARMRAEFLAARSEGNFEPLRALEEIRRSPAKARDAGALDHLRILAESFPPGRVRLETRMVLAEAYAFRLGRSQDAIREYELALWDADPLSRKLIARALYNLYLANGNPTMAHQYAELPGVADDLALDDSRRRRRSVAHLISWGAVGAFVIGAIVGIARSPIPFSKAIRSARLPLVLLAGIWTAATGALLATQYEDGRSAPFLAFGFVQVALLSLAALWGAGSAKTGIYRAVPTVLAVVGAGFLVLEAIDIAYLKGFGL